MTAFIELTIDEFELNRRSKLFVGGEPRRGAGMDSVRRPLRGIEVKDDTHATIRVITAAGLEVPLINSSYPDGEGPSYTNFILQSVTEERVEKSQIIETFGEDFVFFFGERPRMLQVSSVLINTLDFNWYAEFWENYSKYLRGTRCVELGARVYLFYDDIIVSGYMMNAASALTAETNGQMASLNFSLLVFSHENVSFVGDPNYPRRVDADAFSPSVAGLVSTPADLNALPEWLGVQLPDYANKNNNDYKQLDQAGVQNAARSASKEITEVPVPGSAGKGLDKTNTAQPMKPLRGKITDNVDEWTGDFTSFMSAKQISQILIEEAKRLDAEFLKKSCGMGLLSGSPSSLRNMGLLGPGGSLNSLKDAWNSAKSGDWKGAVYNLGQAGIVDVKGSGSFSVSVNGEQYGTDVGAGVDREGMGYGYMNWSADNPYLSGGGVSYGNNGNYSGGAGGAGYYPGAGYFGYGQNGAPGAGSGGRPASNYEANGEWWGYSPGSKSWESGSFDYQGAVPPPPGFAGSPFGGAYPGGKGSYPKKNVSAYTPGYGTQQQNTQTASNQYYSNATGASWDSTNGFQWKNGSSTPAPGQPGGGVFTTQAVPTKGVGVFIDPLSVFKDGGTLITTVDYGATEDEPCGGDKDVDDNSDLFKSGPLESNTII